MEEFYIFVSWEFRFSSFLVKDKECIFSIATVCYVSDSYNWLICIEKIHFLFLFHFESDDYENKNLLIKKLVFYIFVV